MQATVHTESITPITRMFSTKEPHVKRVCRSLKTAKNDIVGTTPDRREATEFIQPNFSTISAPEDPNETTTDTTSVATVKQTHPDSRICEALLRQRRDRQPSTLNASPHGAYCGSFVTKMPTLLTETIRSNPIQQYLFRFCGPEPMLIVGIEQVSPGGAATVNGCKIRNDHNTCEG